MEKNNTRKTWAIIIALISVALILLVIAILDDEKNEKYYDETVSAAIGDCQFKLELAASPAARYKGLSNRKEICPECGMLFVFPDSDKRNFVMRDMDFPLDILYLSGGKVTEILPNLQPEEKNQLSDHISTDDIDMALEVNAGTSERCNIATSSQIYFSVKDYGQKD